VLTQQSFYLGCVISDGQKLLVSWPGSGYCFLLHGYIVTDLTCYTDTVDVTHYGPPSFSLATGQRLEFTVVNSGLVESMKLENAGKLFRSADSMSVDELLAVVYQKMEQRQN
jgi:hypothetical protein